MEKKIFYRQRLPHLQPLGGTFFVTYMLDGSFPKPLLEKWKAQLDWQKRGLMHSTGVSIDESTRRMYKLDFKKKDDFLDTSTSGNHYLKHDALAGIVAGSLHFWDGRRLDLLAYCIMSNHVHAVFRLYDENNTPAEIFLQDVIHSIKRFSALECNKILGKTGQFWQNESYDHWIKTPQEERNCIRYVLHNPIKAGLCRQAADWKWSYLKNECNDVM